MTKKLYRNKKNKIKYFVVLENLISIEVVILEIFYIMIFSHLE
jgi:hypothetical protein